MNYYPMPIVFFLAVIFLLSDAIDIIRKITLNIDFQSDILLDFLNNSCSVLIRLSP